MSGRSFIEWPDGPPRPLFTPEEWQEFWLKMDRAVNGMLTGRPENTISHELAVLRADGQLLGHLGCAILDTIDPGHCERALTRDGA